MEYDWESNRPLGRAGVLAASISRPCHQTGTSQGNAGAQAAETGESVTLGKLTKREDRTVSGASHLTESHWA